MRLVITSIVLLALTLHISRAFFLGDRFVNGGITSGVRALKPRSYANFMPGSSEEVIQL